MRGRYATISVRGTIWHVDDTCTGTVTKVQEGLVTVIDLITRRQFGVRAGGSHQSKAPVEFVVPAPNAVPTSIVTGPDGNVWFTDYAGRIGRSDVAGSIDLFPITPPPSDEAIGAAGPRDIVVGPDGNLWFTDSNSFGIARITPAGQVTYFSTSGDTLALTLGPDKAIWFLEDNSKIGRITTSGALQEFDAPEFSEEDDMTTGLDGNLWATESYSDKIARITLAGTVTEFDAPGTPTGIAVGPDGDLWFTETLLGKIGRMTSAGAVTAEFPVPSGDESKPYKIVLAPDKRGFWFTEQGADALGRITLTGAITEIPLPAQGQFSGTAGVAGVSLGPGGAIWFTEQDSGLIGCVAC